MGKQPWERPHQRKAPGPRDRRRRNGGLTGSRRCAGARAPTVRGEAAWLSPAGTPLVGANAPAPGGLWAASRPWSQPLFLPSTPRT